MNRFLRYPFATLIISAAIWSNSILQAEVRYVDASATGNGNGVAWSDAFTSLNEAITIAQSGDEIWVAAGTYFPTQDTDRTAAFELKNGVAILGGFQGNETMASQRNADPRTNGTILSGDIGVLGTVTDNAYHVVTGVDTDRTALLSGFTITLGYADGDSGIGQKDGAGLWLGTVNGTSSGSPTITDCRFVENSGDVDNFFGGGGAIHGANGSSPRIERCWFENNSSRSSGAAINVFGGFNGTTSVAASPEIRECVFIGNTSLSDGGAIKLSNVDPSSAVIELCHFEANSSRAGGAISVSSDLIVRESSFIKNTASNDAGAINVSDDKSSPNNTQFINCRFEQNTASNDAGAALLRETPVIFTNCVFVGNSAGDEGGAIYTLFDATPTFVNCTFSGNKANDTGGAIRNFGRSIITLQNSIIWGNYIRFDSTPPIASVDNSAALEEATTIFNNTLVEHFDLSPGSQPAFDGTNSDNAPRFVELPEAAGVGDLRLQIGSPAIDAGMDEFNNTLQDIASNPRKIGTIDLGAYEGGVDINNATIPDDAVRAAVEIELDIQSGDPIPFTVLATLFSLTVDSSTTVDLTGLEDALDLFELTIQTDRLLSTLPITNLVNLEKIKLIAPKKEGLFFTHWSDGSQENPRILQNTGSQSIELVAQYASTPLSPFAGGYALIVNGTVTQINNLPVELNVQVGDPYELRVNYLIQEQALIGATDTSLAGLEYNLDNSLPKIAMESEVRINEFRWILRTTNSGIEEAAIAVTKIGAAESFRTIISDTDNNTETDFPFSLGSERIEFQISNFDISLFEEPLKIPDNPGYVNWNAIDSGDASIRSSSAIGDQNWFILLSHLPGPDQSYRIERHPSYLDLTQRILGYPADRPSVGQNFSSENIVLNWTDPYADNFETTYEVWRGTSNNLARAILIASDPDDLFYRDRTTKPGIEYFYWIRAIRDGLKADFSGANSSARSVKVPEDIQATQGDFSDRIRISWARVSGATDYSVYRSDTSDLNDAELLAEGIISNEYEDLSPDTDNLYYYWVKSNAFNETSDFSESTSGYRVANGITSVRASDGLFVERVQVTWDAFPGATSYDIYRNSVNDSSSASILATNITTTLYDDLPGQESQGVTFFYWVRPNIGGQIGSFSNSDAGYIPVERNAKILAWGDNDFDQTNIPDTSLLDIIEIAAGANHSLALSSNGTVVGWGRDEFGQSTPPGGLTDVVDIAVGYDHSLALKRDGTVEAWGRNTFGKASVPRDLANVIDIEAGAEHSLALLADGSVVGWGGNDSGQIDIPDNLTQVVQISAGGYHNLARLADGSVVTWGDNSLGQQNIPARISRVIDISAGWNHSLVILPNGTVDGWGDNSRGQLDFPADTQAPPQAKGLVIRDPVTARIVDISGGLFHSLALSAKGEVAAWGENKNSQTETPEGLGIVSQIDAGDEFNLIVEESALPKIESIIPGNTSLLSGEDVVLRVRATGGPDMTFQWLFNNALIDGATDEALLLSDIRSAGVGSYSVKVTSGGNEVSSSPIQIDVTTNQATITTQTVRALRTYNGTYLFSPIETNPPGLKLDIRSPGNLILPSTTGTHTIAVDIDQDGYDGTPIENATLELDVLTGESLQLVVTESAMTIRYLAPEGFSSTLQTSPNLRDWTTLATIPNGDGGYYEFPLFIQTDDFYRVVFEIPTTN